MLRCVLFDLDCTLADRLRSIDAYLDRFLERFGDDLRAVDRQIVRAALGDADSSGYAADTRATAIVTALDWSTTPAIDAIDEHWRVTFPDCAVAMDGALDVLDELREDGMALGVLTNGTVRAQEAKIAHLDLSDRIDVQGATEAGLTAIWLRGWQDWPTDDPPAEHVVDRLVEVPPLLASL